MIESLLTKHKIDPKMIGRLEVGCESLVDKNKQLITFFMNYFGERDNNDIEGRPSDDAEASCRQTRRRGEPQLCLTQLPGWKARLGTAGWA